MWYVLQADAGSSIIVGFKKDSNAAEYIENLNNKTLLSLLDTVPFEVGDVFFLETGTVHAIGAGLLIAEIQQTSDITYRLYDFDRVDADGNTRALHIDLALDAINYDKIDAKKSYQNHENTSNEMVDCNYFTTNYIPLSGTMKFEKDGRSFHVYMCTEGDFTITQENVAHHYRKGDTILMPAAISIFEFTGNASLLEIYIK
jgi:mannose-6-phosphate isomerase